MLKDKRRGIRDVTVGRRPSKIIESIDEQKNKTGKGTILMGRIEQLTIDEIKRRCTGLAEEKGIEPQPCTKRKCTPAEAMSVKLALPWGEKVALMNPEDLTIKLNDGLLKYGVKKTEIVKMFQFKHSTAYHKHIKDLTESKIQGKTADMIIVDDPIGNGMACGGFVGEGTKIAIVGESTPSPAISAEKMKVLLKDLKKAGIDTETPEENNVHIVMVHGEPLGDKIPVNLSGFMSESIGRRVRVKPEALEARIAEKTAEEVSRIDQQMAVAIRGEGPIPGIPTAEHIVAGALAEEIAKSVAAVLKDAVNYQPDRPIVCGPEELKIEIPKFWDEEKISDFAKSNSINYETVKAAADKLHKVDEGMAENRKQFNVPYYFKVIEVLQEALPPEEFAGYLKGSVIGRALSAGQNGDQRTDVAKVLQFAKWWAQALNGERINPREAC